MDEGNLSCATHRSPPCPGRAVRLMRLVLALRNLLHDRVSLALVAGGVAVAIMLVHVQLGLFSDFGA